MIFFSSLCFMIEAVVIFKDLPKLIQGPFCVKPLTWFILLLKLLLIHTLFWTKEFSLFPPVCVFRLSTK